MKRRPTLSLGGRVGSAIVGVLTVTPEESRDIKPYFGTTYPILDSPYYSRFNDPTIKSHDVVLRQLGDRGNDVSALGAKALIEDFRPSYIILVGIAGGVSGRDNTELGDVVVPIFIDGYEMRKLTKGTNKKRTSAYDHPSYRLVRFFAEHVGNSSDWLQRVNTPRPTDRSQQQPKMILGTLIFGEKILGDDTNDYQRSILNEFDNAVAVDMESGGLARAVYEARITKHYNPLYLVVRGISDPVNEPDNDDIRKVWRPYAAHVAGAFAAETATSLINQEYATAAVKSAG